VTRATVIVAEPIPYEGLSTRKLVIETAYYNVLTAYSFEELTQTCDRFPEADAIVVHSELPQYSSRGMKSLREKAGDKPIIMISSSGHEREPSADVVLSSHDPQLLLGKIRELVGEPDVEGLFQRARPK
jgi:hypothetical protein